MTRATSSPPSGQASSPTGRLVFLDGIRALAATAVVLHHGYQTVTVEGGLRRYLFFLRYGNFAVAIFLVVSGYSLAVASSRRAHSQRYIAFVTRRAWRIVPPYLAAVVLSILLTMTLISSVTGTPWDLVLPLSWAGVGVNALLLQDVVAARAPNHVFWSIAVEWHLYFLFPLLVAVRRRSHLSLVIVGALGCGLLWLRYAGQPFAGFPPQLFALFVMGILAGHLATETSRRAADLRARVRLGWTVLAVVTALPVAALLARLDESYFFAELVLGAAVAAFLVASPAAPSNHPARRFLEWRPLAWVGVFSYSLYLTHAPIVQILWQYGVHPLKLGPNAELAGTLLGATLTSLAVAFTFHVLFERPFMNHRSVREIAAALKIKRELPGALPEHVASSGPADQDADARVRAVETLAASGNREALNMLMGAIRDPDQAVRAAAYRRLADAPSWVLWMALGRCPDRPDLISSIVGKAARDRLEALVLERFSSPDVGDRVLALELTGLLGVETLLIEALEALTDPEVAIRRAAAEHLKGFEPAIPALLAVLRDDPVPAVRLKALQVLAEAVAGDGVRVALVDALEDPAADVRHLAVEILLRNPPSDLADQLAARLTASNLDSVGALLLAMGPIGEEALAAAVTEGSPPSTVAGQLLRETDMATRVPADLGAVDPRVRLRAVVLLGAIGGPKVLKGLVSALSDPRPEIRAEAALSLGRTGGEGRGDVQLLAESDQAPEVQEAAAQALAMIDERAHATNGAGSNR